MITVRVLFGFPARAPLREELYSTLVSVTPAAFARGEHLQIALWRARVCGHVTAPLRAEVGSPHVALGVPSAARRVRTLRR